MTRFTDSPYERIRKLPVLPLCPKATPVMAAEIMEAPA